MKNITLFIFILLTFFSLNSCAQNSDKLVGIWKVDNEFNKATYEIVQVDNKFFGKVHQYTSESKTYTGNNKKEDYFLIDIEKKDNTYVNGKMYFEKDDLVDVKIVLVDKDKIKISLTVEGYPYSEIWNRKQ